MTNKLLILFKLSALLIALILFFSCSQNSISLTTTQTGVVKDSVQILANNTAKGLATKGPIAWLDYFEDSPDFFMASDGSMTFKNYRAADVFVKDTLIKQ